MIAFTRARTAGETPHRATPRSGASRAPAPATKFSLAPSMHVCRALKVREWPRRETEPMGQMPAETETKGATPQSQ